MINETYHAWAGIPILLVLAWIFDRYFSRVLFFAPYVSATYIEIRDPKRPHWLAVLVTIVLLPIGLWGSASQYPLRWSDAFVSQNMFLANLAMNPLHYFVDSLESRKQTFDADKTRAHYAQMAEYLGVLPDGRDEQNLKYWRPIDLTP